MWKAGTGIFNTIFLTSFLWSTALSGQLTEDFSDGELAHDPRWGGDTSHFVISTSSAIPAELHPGLQLKSQGTDTSCLFTQQAIKDHWEWSFWIKLSFNSSTNNFARVYILAGDTCLDKAPDGYYLEVGGPDDSVRLCRSAAGDVLVLITAVRAVASSSTNAFFFRITYGPGHEWKLYSGSESASSIAPEGSARDPVNGGLPYFGLFFKYTSSNATKFYFDELVSCPLQVDTVAPAVVSVRPVNPHQLEITFSEMIDTTSLSETVTVWVKETRDTCQLIPGNDLAVLMAVATASLEEEHSYTLSVEGVRDAEGNVMEEAEHHFTYFIPGLFSLCITEIMPDPFPSSGLPSLEYLEIFNPTGHPIYLEGMTLSINGSPMGFGRITASPGEYLIVCHILDTAILRDHGKVAGLNGFAIPNSGAVIVLRDRNGCFIAGTEYATESSDPRAEGGFSLEMIDWGRPCLGTGNWDYSSDDLGGTPGRENSLSGFNETEPCSFYRACVTAEGELLLKFRDIMDSASLVEPGHYEIAGKPGGISHITVTDDLFREVKIQTSFLPEAQEIYEIHGDGLLLNGCGEQVDEKTLLFGLPARPGTGDLVINEILFNPLGDEKDYIEIYNRSSLVVDLSDLVVGSLSHSPPSPPDTVISKVCNECRLLLPGAFALLTEDPAQVMSSYVQHDPAAMVKSDLPAMKNEGGEIFLMDSDHHIIERVQFSEDMHFPLLQSVEGVSLERVHPDRPASLKENWQSASEVTGFGTPGTVNSQYTAGMYAREEVSLHPTVFSPDGDGHEDILSIHYSFGLPGISGSVTVFSESGEWVRKLVCNDLLGAEGVLYWDGKDEEGRRAPFGIYILLVEVFDMDGHVKKYKLAAGLTDRRYTD